MLVALLAWLARRWEALDLVYKCMLASLLLHLLFLWYSRKVDVEAPDVGPGAGEDKYEVRLLGNVLDAVAQMGDRATGDQVGGGGENAGEGLVAHALTRAAALLQAAADAAPGEAGAFDRTSAAAPSRPDGERAPVGPSNVAAARPLAGNPPYGPEELFQRLGGDAVAPTLAADGASDQTAVAAREGARRQCGLSTCVAGGGGEGAATALHARARHSPNRARGAAAGARPAAAGRVAPATEA